MALAVLEDGSGHLQTGTRPIMTLLKTEEGVGARQVVVLTPEVAQDPGEGRAGYAGETVGIPDDGVVKDAIGTPRANRQGGTGLEGKAGDMDDGTVETIHCWSSWR